MTVHSFGNYAAFLLVGIIADPVSAQVVEGPVLGRESALQAQADDTGDIIVTATKRPQTLQEVPISVGVVSGQAIDNQGYKLFTDLQAAVPNLQIDNTNGNYAITIRGLGSGAGNLAYEQSVGLFVDGVYSSRARSLQIPFLDVERVEVVRGPQGALFGKNTNAGAISLVTRKPTRTFEAEARGGFELAEGGFSTSGFVSGPLGGTLSGRLSASLGNADGFIDNRLIRKEENSSYYYAGRGQLLWEPVSDFDALLKVEGFRNRIDGSNAMFNKIGNPGCNLCNLVRAASGGAAAQEYPAFFRTSRLNPREYDVTTSGTGVLTLTWTPGDWSVGSISAYQKLDSTRTFNTVPGGLPLLNTLQEERTRQFSQEVRASRDIIDGVNLAFGATYVDADLSLRQNVYYNGNASGLPTLPDALAERLFDQSTWSLSPYAILDVEVTDRLTLNGSLRYSYEDKDARGRQIVTGQRIPANNLPFDLRGTREEKLWDYSARARYEFSPAVNVYVSYATGTKGGGFISNDGLLLYNLNNGNGSFQYEDEQAKSLEIGTKLRLLDRRLDLDVAMFRTKFKNLQVSSYNGTAFIQGNAAEATSQGVEFDARFRPVRVVSIGLNGAYLDAKYDDYPGGACLYNAPATCNAKTNNLAGTRLTRAPEWKGAAYIQVDLPVGGAMIATARGAADYTALSYMQADLNPLNAQPGYTKYDARLALRAEDDTWSIALVGRNLTNEVTFSQAFNTPLLGNDSHVVMVNPPRMVTLEGVVRF